MLMVIGVLGIDGHFWDRKRYPFGVCRKHNDSGQAIEHNTYNAVIHQKDHGTHIHLVMVNFAVQVFWVMILEHIVHSIYVEIMARQGPWNLNYSHIRLLTPSILYIGRDKRSKLLGKNGIGYMYRNWLIVQTSPCHAMQ